MFFSFKDSFHIKIIKRWGHKGAIPITLLRVHLGLFKWPYITNAAQTVIVTSGTYLCPKKTVTMVQTRYWKTVSGQSVTARRISLMTTNMAPAGQHGDIYQERKLRK